MSASALTQAIAAEDREKSAHGVTSLLQGLLNWRVVYLGAIYFLIQACVYGVVYYLPPQVGRLLGRNVGFVVGVVTAVPWCFALAGLLLCAALRRTHRPAPAGGQPDHAGLRRRCITVFFTGAGPLAALAALCVAVAGFIAVQPLFWTLPTAYLRGAAAAPGLALVNVLGALAGSVAPAYRLVGRQSFWRRRRALCLGIQHIAGCGDDRGGRYGAAPKD